MKLLFLLLMISAHAYSKDPALTMKKIDHVGITVPNIAEASKFFIDTFGCAPLTHMGPFNMDHSMSNDRKQKVKPRAKTIELSMITCGDGTNIELFEYKNSKGKKTPPDHEDLGGHHIAFYTENIHEAVKYLREKGLTVIGEPMVMTFGETAGETWVHFMSPWGLELELGESPKGKAVETNFVKQDIIITKHFDAINELDSAKRDTLFDLAYSSNIDFIDPFFTVVGHKNLKNMYDELHKKFPQHQFVVTKVETHHDSTRAKWNLVDAKGKIVHTGEDFILFANGKIAKIYVFIDNHNYKDTSYETHK
ncbi:VOC family protein [Peredibacter starrii]|uniref:VOC family protein n=1 Tax=Peredibacter starrii TaxID=28202 RepID=A0AAX4HTH9_9BACT|nr:VOC family protein [Peredibacter starrii]WPU66517.1 VOC family protein [Peredibacter starrii]